LRKRSPVAVRRIRGLIFMLRLEPRMRPSTGSPEDSEEGEGEDECADDGYAPESGRGASESDSAGRRIVVPTKGVDIRLVLCLVLESIAMLEEGGSHEPDGSIAP
jgi:hypothetical protein